MFEISIPAGAKKIISLLQSNGYEAYVVGGCVRDSLLGLRLGYMHIRNTRRSQALSFKQNDRYGIKTRNHNRCCL